MDFFKNSKPVKGYIVCTQRFYNVHIAKIEDQAENSDNEEKSKKKNITFYNLEGNVYWSRYYYSRPLEVTKLEPRTIQSTIVKKLLAEYNDKGYAVVNLRFPYDPSLNLTIIYVP